MREGSSAAGSAGGGASHLGEGAAPIVVVVVALRVDAPYHAAEALARLAAVEQAERARARAPLVIVDTKLSTQQPDGARGGESLGEDGLQEVALRDHEARARAVAPGGRLRLGPGGEGLGADADGVFAPVGGSVGGVVLDGDVEGGDDAWWEGGGGDGWKRRDIWEAGRVGAVVARQAAHR